MTDLEMTRLCAEAMGIQLTQPVTYRDAMGGLRAIPNQAITDVHLNDSGLNYDPLHRAAQAMALVKKFGFGISQSRSGVWVVNDPVLIVGATDKDLNRAIVECVAKMQAEKK